MLADHLIILPCHGIWKTDGDFGSNAEEWHLAPFQVDGQDHLCFRDHIVRSLDLLESNESSILVISGGQTKKDAGPISEAFSYYSLGMKIAPEKSDLFKRVVTEDYARDSFENVIFLICRFFEITSTYPKNITIVGFSFKQQRFLTYHLDQALKFPFDRIVYIGNSPTPFEHIDRLEYFEKLHEAERENALQHFENDWYGIRAPLRNKRNGRNPFQRQHKYAETNAKLSDFLNCLHDESHGLSDSQIREKITIQW